MHASQLKNAFHPILLCFVKSLGRENRESKNLGRKIQKRHQKSRTSGVLSRSRTPRHIRLSIRRSAQTKQAHQAEILSGSDTSFAGRPLPKAQSQSSRFLEAGLEHLLGQGVLEVVLTVMSLWLSTRLERLLCERRNVRWFEPVDNIGIDISVHIIHGGDGSLSGGPRWHFRRVGWAQKGLNFGVWGTLVWHREVGRYTYEGINQWMLEIWVESRDGELMIK